MNDTDLLLDRLRRLEKICVDGRDYWRLRDLCDALRLDSRRVGGDVPAYSRIRRYEYRRGFRSRIVTLIDLNGAESLIVRRCTIPRVQALEALKRSGIEQP